MKLHQYPGNKITSTSQEQAWPRFEILKHRRDSTPGGGEGKRKGREEEKMAGRRDKTGEKEKWGGNE